MGNIFEASSRSEIYPLLFDPQVQFLKPCVHMCNYDLMQTSGGLLICVPTNQVKDVITALQIGGYPDTCEIGRTKHRSSDEFASLVDLIL